MTELRRISANAGWLLSGKAFGGALSLGYLALATRTLGLVDFGRFALVIAIGQAVAGFVGFQTWQFVVRYGVIAHAAGDQARVERIIAFATALDLAAALVGSVLALVAIVTLGPLLGLGRDLYAPAMVFCLSMLLAIRSTPTGILRLDDRFRDAAVADAVTPSVRAAGAVSVALFMPTVTGFLAVWAVAELLTAAVFWRVALRRRRLVPTFAGLRRTAREEEALWQFVGSTNLSSSLSQTVQQVTLLAVGAAAGPAAAGAFRLAGQLAQALVKLTQSLARAGYGELARAFASGTEDARLLVRLTGLAIILSAAMVGIAALLGRPLLTLVAGHEFAGAYLPVVLLVAAAALELSGFAFEPAMTARGRAGLALKLRAIASAVQAVLLVTLLSRYGAIGGAWATLGGSLTWLLLSGSGAFSRRS